MERIAAGGIVAFGLIVAADHAPTAPIAVGLAYLILLTSLLTVGPIAGDRLSVMIGVRSGVGGKEKAAP